MPETWTEYFDYLKDAIIRNAVNHYPLDMFPHTAHVETVILLQRRNA